MPEGFISRGVVDRFDTVSAHAFEYDFDLSGQPSGAVTMSNRERIQVAMFVVSGHDAGQTIEVTTNSGGNSSTAIQYPTITPSWGNEETLWLQVGGFDGGGNHAFTSQPGGYDNSSFVHTSTDGVGRTSGWRVAAAASETPGSASFDGGGDQTVAMSIAVRLATVGGNSSPVADAGPDQGVLVSDTVQLDGSGSSDVDGDALSYSWVLTPAAGSAATLSDATAVNPTFVADVAGTYVADLVVNDGTVDSAPDSMVVTAAGNNAPVANDDSYGFVEDETLTVAAPGVLGNDTDADGDTLTAVLSTGVSNGILTFSADGSFIYTPDPGFGGVDNFTYVANDGTDDSVVAAVSLTAAGANQAPVANDQALTVADGVATDITLSYSDSDGPGPYTFTIVQYPQNGSIGGDDGDAQISYTAAPGFVGTDSLTFQVNDGLDDSNVATILLNVQHFPGTTWETRLPSEVGLDGSKLDEFALSVGGVGTIVKDGYVVKTWGSQTAKADWASAAKPMTGNLLFFAMKEGLINSPYDLIGDEVLAAYGIPLSVDDQGMTFWHLGNNLSGYARIENPGDAWAYNDIGAKLYGQVVMEVFGDTLDSVATSRLAPLQLQDGSLFTSRGGFGISTSTRDFARIGWFWLNNGNWNGEQVIPETVFEEFMRSQVPGNTPRTTAADADYLGVGTLGGGTDQTPYGPGIYGMNWWFNDTVGTTGNLAWPDAPIDTIQANGHFGDEMVVLIPSLNMVVTNRGEWGSFEPGNPNSGINANLRLLVEASPTGSNSVPVAVDDNYDVTQDSTLIINAPGVLTNDTDANGDTLTASLESDVANGTLSLAPDGSFNYTPAPGFIGVDGFDYRASDGIDLGNVASVTINVNSNSNSAPQITSSPPIPGQVGATYNYDVDASDPDTGDTLTFSLDLAPTGMTVDSLTGLISWTPVAGQEGANAVTVRVVDDAVPAQVDTQTFDVFIDPTALTTPNLIHFSTSGDVAIPGVPTPYDDGDIYRFNIATGQYDRVFDADLVGLPANADIDALHVVDPVTFYLSFGANGGTNVPGLGVVQDADVVLYHAGDFSWHLQGSDVGLSAGGGEDIDGLHELSDGSLVVSTTGAASVTGGVAAGPEDILRCDGSFGASSTCNWSVYLDGSDVGLGGNTDETINGLDESASDIYINTVGPFSAPGLNSDESDVFRCVGTQTGLSSSCTSFAGFFDGSSYGLTQQLDAIDFVPDALADPDPGQFRVVVIGSSTPAGTGASSYANSWVGLLDAWLGTVNANHQVINLAEGGYDSRDFRADGSTPLPDANRNITRVLELNPDMIIVNLPSNDIGQGIPIATTISYFNEMKALADAAGALFYVTTTQPRSSFDATLRALLRDEATAIRNEFTTNVIDIYDDLKDNDIDLGLLPAYDSGDGTHLNDAGHNVVFVKARDTIASVVPP
jgi:lysophospholipase L1-like esterase